MTRIYYRLIALVTAASKLFEICILKILETYLITHDHQFKFKAKRSQTCVYLLLKLWLSITLVK